MTTWKDTYQTINADTLRLAENAPMINPVATMHNRPDIPFNNLLGKSFQFAYQWVYKDYRRSILSPYSEICVSKELFATESTAAGDEDNYVAITFHKGNTEVIKVVLLCSENNSGSWFVISEYEKTQDDITKELSSPGQTGVYEFFNDSAREYIDLTSAGLTYHNVPISAKNIEVVDDIVVFGNCETGRDTVAVDYDLGVVYGEGLTASHTDISVSFVVSPSGHYEESIPDVICTIVAPTVAAFDVITLSESFTSKFGHGFDYVGTEFLLSFYTVFSSGKTSAEVAAFLKDALVDSIVYRRRWQLLPETEWSSWSDGVVEISTVTGESTSSVQIKLKYAYNPPHDGSDTYPVLTVVDGASWIGQSSKGKNTFKSYSYYNVGVAYYDAVGRTSGVLLGEGKRIYIPGGEDRAVDNRQKSAQISWVVRNAAPAWAKYFRWCISESVNIASVFPFKTTIENLPGNVIVTYSIEYNGRACTAVDCKGFGYEYVQGDYLLIEGSPNVIKPVLGYLSVIKPADEDVFGSFLIVPFDSDPSIYTNKVLYVHRPKSTLTDYVYYEDTNTYTVASGVHAVASGVISCGDAWLMNRRFSKNGIGFTDDPVEDFVINTNYNLRAYSKGRPLVSLKDFEQRRTQSIIWGGRHFRDTKTTEIAAFNFTDTKTFDAQFGEINGLVLVGGVLKVLQERKETSIYVGKSVFTDAGGQVQLSQIDALFGNINPSETNSGTEDKRSVLVSNRSLYYWDQDKGDVIRSSPNGQIAISKLGMEKYFQAKRLAIDTAKLAGTATDVLFGRDADRNELIVVFKIGQVVEAIVFDEDNNRWMMFADYWMTVSGVVYGPDYIVTDVNQALSFINGTLYQHEKNSASNTIYGGNSKVEIIGVMNDSPVVEKMYQDMEVDADGVFYVSTETPKSATCSTGMSTYTVPATFRRKNGKYCAPFLRNTRFTNGNDDNLIYTGRKMQGRYAKLTITSTNPVPGNGSADAGGDRFEFREMQVNWLAL